jgi:hypothetical protein
MKSSQKSIVYATSVYAAVLLFLSLALFSSSILSHPKEKLLHPVRTPSAPRTSADPEVQYAAHTKGRMTLAIANNGTFGTFGDEIFDPISGDLILSCVYPRNSDILYLYVGAFWIGAVVGRDTLVSCGSEDFYVSEEFWPEAGSFGKFARRSIDRNSQYFSTRAVSEEDILTEYTDTIVRLAGIDSRDGRPHIPLGIKVSQRSMAWSYEYADDFILFDYEIENIGPQRLRKVYFGIWIDGDVWHISRRGPIGWEDDMVGFLRTWEAPEGGGYLDTVNIAWTADNDGDPVNGAFDIASPRNIVGARVVRTPSDSLSYSFNWWVTNYSDISLDFGPRMAGNEEEPFRNFVGRQGTPEGDRNKYYMMRKPEFDYDQLYTSQNQSFNGFLPPPNSAADFADGFDTRYLLSFGPFDIDPGQKLPLSFAWVGGTNLHTSTDGIAAFNPVDPQSYYFGLDFSNFAENARWAEWVYDNPGVDSDGDGYSGEFRRSGIDTFWTKGDGVPDYRGAGPPPTPVVRLYPTTAEIVVRWNGYYTETTPDLFLRKKDFEGYRVYLARDDRENSWSLLSSYDREDYNRFRWKTISSDSGAWVLEETPFTLDSLRSIMGLPDLDPLEYTSVRPLRIDTNLYYFEPQDFNLSDLNDSRNIHKVYPLASNPGTDSSLWEPEDITMEHGIPLPKFYEYEYVIKNLLPSVSYFVSVTTFDFGSPRVGLKSLESSVYLTAINEFPMPSSDTVAAQQLDVVVYPNPYRIDDDYAARGYENRAGDQTTERSRRIHFANLPPLCKLLIYSIDGDLIQEINHDEPPGSPGSQHIEWDVVSRNRQEVVSGLYYFVVQAPGRTQIGKLMILK